MGKDAVVRGSVLEIRHKDSLARESIHVRHTFEDLIRAVDLAIDTNSTLTVVPYTGPQRTIDPDQYRALAVFHYRGDNA